MTEQEFVTNTLLRKIGKDFLGYVPARVVPAIASFLGLSIYTRLLDPAQYGMYVITMTTVSIFTAVGFNWLNSSNLRYFKKYEKEQKLSKLISTGIFILVSFFIVGSILWYGVTAVLKPYLGGNLVHLLRIGILLVGSQAGFSFIIAILRANRQTVKYGFYSSIQSLGTVILGAGFLHIFKLGPEGIIWGTIIATFGLAARELFLLIRDNNVKLSNLSLNLLSKLGSYGVPLVGVTLGSNILSLADRYMIQFFIGVDEVGIYSSGYNIANRGVILLFSVLLTASYPIMVQTYEQKGENQTRIIFERVMELYFLILIPGVLGITVLAPDITEVILGKSFQRANIFMPWVASGVFCLGLTNLISYIFGLKERTLYALYLVLGASLLNMILNFFLIPAYGAVGAAYATFLSYSIYVIFSWSLGSKLFSFAIPWKTFLKAVLSAIIMYLSLGMVMPALGSGLMNLVIKILTGMSIYLILILFLKEKNSLRLIRYLNKFLIDTN